MNVSRLILFSFAILIAKNDAFRQRSSRNLPYFIMGRPPHGLRPDPIKPEELNRAGYVIQTATLPQRLDHFNASDARTWAQRYHYNFNYYKSGGPIFLMLGGEGPETGSWCVDEKLPYIQWAMSHNAAIYDLEHRFYGQSRPFPTQSIENLKYLSSRQAIEDAAYFIRYINEQQKYVNPKWIVFGGSYSGALAAWLREKHPELVIGAVGSSGPVEAKLDFYEYLEVVENALRSYAPECADAVQQGFTEMSKMIWTLEGRKNLSELFVLNPKLNETKLRYKDIQNFFATIYGYFQWAVQYSGDNAGSYAIGGGISEICPLMMNTSMDYLNRIKSVIVYLTEFDSSISFTSVGIDYDEMIEFLADERYDPSGYYSADRSWVWQTCTEFGYFQSTDLGRNIFGSVTPVNLFVDMCTDTFGSAYKIQAIENSIHMTRKYYGGKDHFKGTNVVLPNGDIDPWHALGLYSNIEPSVVPILIHGTAHCADMYPARTQDLPALTNARNIIASNINKWLNGTQAQKLSQTHSVMQSRQQRMPPRMKPFTSTLKPVQLKPFAEEMRTIEDIPAHLPRFFRGRPLRGFLVEPPTSSLLVDYPPGFVAGNITMPVDHFDLTNMNTFDQRYWVNPQYAQPGGPHFLVIGGEGRANVKWVTEPNLITMSMARKFNATVYMLEHRYYGDSFPTPDQSTENLRWLTATQALADLAQFIMTMNERYNLVNPKWVTFGGSYPGMLSAWFRQFYPQLSVGAVASSAPIEAKVDFYEYLIVVENALRVFNATCAENVKLAFDQIHQLSLTRTGRVTLSNLFTLKPEWNLTTEVTNLDIQYFFSILYDKFQGAVQYNNDNTGSYATGGGIREVCGYMLNNAKTPMENVADVNIYMTNFSSGTFSYTDNNYQNYIDYLKDVNAKSSSRSWTYQTCNEFGFFQSTDVGENIFGGPIPVNIFIDMCQDVYGSKFTPRFVYEAVDKSQRFYGGRDYFKGTNVLFTNGNIDPWHALSKYDGNGSVTTVLMNGTAHCADMYPPRDEDAADLAPTRELIGEKIAEWLAITTSSAAEHIVHSLSPLLFYFIFMLIPRM
uniref:Serine protease n=1 Tax=Ascaris suum TaxID=6253 RepID=F1KTW1_ASCSU